MVTKIKAILCSILTFSLIIGMATTTGRAQDHEPLKNTLNTKVSRTFRRFLQHHPHHLNLKEILTREYMGEKLIWSHQDKTMLRALVKTDLPENALKKMGIKVLSKAGNIYSVILPPQALKPLATNTKTKFIAAPQKLEPKNDRAMASGLQISGLFAGVEINYNLVIRSPSQVEIHLVSDPNSSFDPYLVLKDLSGHVLAEDDNGGAGSDSSITYTFTFPGTYELTVQGTGTGHFRLLVFSKENRFSASDIYLGSSQGLYMGTDSALFGAKGKNVIVGIVDSGIDWCHPDFIDPDTGTSRILYLWDQTLSPQAGESSPSPYGYGVEYDQNIINSALLTCNHNLVREKDDEGHGTHVAGTAAGNGEASQGKYTGAAPQAKIIFVKTTFSDADIMDGVSYIFEKAAQLGMPAVVNLSLGGHAGPHDGTSLLSQALDQLSGEGKIVVVAAGNEGGDSVHAQLDMAHQVEGEMDLSTSCSTSMIDMWHDGGDGYLIRFDLPQGVAPSDVRSWVWDKNLLDNGTGPTQDADGCTSTSDCGAWGTGNGSSLIGYPNSANQALVTPFIDLIGLSHPVLSFYAWYSLEEDYDYVYVEASVDGGETWIPLTPQGPNLNPCTDSIFGFTGDSEDWTPYTFDLSAFAGKRIQIRWVIFSDNSITQDGFFLDNVGIEDSQSHEIAFFEDFDGDNGNFSTSFLNSLAIKPGQTAWGFIGKYTGGALDGAQICVDYTTTSSPLNGDSEVFASIDTYSCTSVNQWPIHLTKLTGGGSGKVDAWIANNEGYKSFFTGEATPLDPQGRNFGSVGMPGTAHRVVTVGAYTTRSSWIDYMGSGHKDLRWTLPGTGSTYEFDTMGDLAIFSSLGPTRDGRIKPDIAAPGERLVSVLSNDVEDPTPSDIVPYEDQQGRYWLMQGTSMATPVVTGLVAQYLSRHPHATPEEIKTNLALNALIDSATGTDVPNNYFGWGKAYLSPTMEVEGNMTANQESFTGSTDYYSSHLELGFTVSGINGKTGDIYFMLTQPAAEGGMATYYLVYDPNGSCQPFCIAKGRWTTTKTPYLSHVNFGDSSQPLASDGIWYIYGPGPDGNPQTMDVILNDGWVPPANVANCSLLPNGNYTFSVVYQTDEGYQASSLTVTLDRPECR